jgi:hypothetical protein
MTIVPQQTYTPILANLPTPDVRLQQDNYTGAAEAFARSANSLANITSGAFKAHKKEAKEAAKMKNLAEFENKVASISESVANGMSAIQAENELAQLNKTYAPITEAGDRAAVVRNYTNIARASELQTAADKSWQETQIDQEKAYAESYEKIFPGKAAGMSEKEKAIAGRRLEIEASIAADVITGNLPTSSLKGSEYYGAISALASDVNFSIQTMPNTTYLEAGRIAEGKAEYMARLSEKFNGQVDIRALSVLADEVFRPFEQIAKDFGDNVKMNKETLSSLLDLETLPAKKMIEVAAPAMQYSPAIKDAVEKIYLNIGMQQGVLAKDEKGKLVAGAATSIGSIATKGGQVPMMDLNTGKTVLGIPALSKESFGLYFSIAQKASSNDDEYTQKVNAEASSNVNKQAKVQVAGKQNPTTEDLAKAYSEMPLEDLQTAVKNSKGILETTSKLVAAYANIQDPATREAIKLEAQDAAQLYLLGGLTRLQNDLKTGSFWGDDYMLRVNNGRVRVYEKNKWTNFGKTALTTETGDQYIDITDSKGFLGIGEGPQQVFRSHMAELDAVKASLINNKIITEEEWEKMLQSTTDLVSPTGKFEAPSGAGLLLDSVSEKVGEVTETAVSAPVKAMASAAEATVSTAVNIFNSSNGTIAPDEDVQRILASSQRRSPSGRPVSYNTPMKVNGEMVIGFETPMSYFDTEEGKRVAAAVAPEFWDRYSKDKYDAHISKEEAMNIEWLRQKKLSESKASIEKLSITNPGNIKASKANDWEGKTGQTYEKQGQSFEVFESPEMGFRAIFKLLDTYKNKYGADTLEEIGNRWDSESAETYIKNLVKITGFKKDTKIDLSNRKQAIKLAKAIAQIEKGSSSMKYSTKQIEAGYDLAFPPQETFVQYY